MKGQVKFEGQGREENQKPEGKCTAVTKKTEVVQYLYFVLTLQYIIVYWQTLPALRYCVIKNAKKLSFVVVYKIYIKPMKTAYSNLEMQ